MFYRNLLVILTLSSVGLVAYADKGEIKPGARDYPELNPSPVAKVPITGTLPEGWSLHLMVEFTTGKHSSHLILPGPDCEYDASGGIAGAMFPYQLITELPVSQEGTNFSAQLVLDQFKPGRCEWHVAGLSYRVVANGPTAAGSLARSPIGMVSPDPFAHTNVENLWCWQSAPPWTERGYVCNDGISRAAHASLSDIPVARRGNTQELPIPPTPSSYRFIFHDLRAEVQTSEP